MCFGEVPYQPYMREIFESAECFFDSVFFVEDYSATYVCDDAALSWYSKFSVKIVVYVCYCFHFLLSDLCVTLVLESFEVCPQVVGVLGHCFASYFGYGAYCAGAFAVVGFDDGYVSGFAKFVELYA